MKMLVKSLIVLLLCSVSWGEVSTSVYLADGNTPLLYNEIMVGMNLKIKVSSTEAEDFDGYLLLADSNSALANLNADFNFPSESIYPEAGTRAYIERFIQGSFYDIGDVNGTALGTWQDPSAGDWFIVDYNAVVLGDCVVGFYSEVPMSDQLTFIEDIPLTHVKTRDFNNNARVGLDDYAVVAKYWQHTDCADSNDCGGADLEPDGDVDFDDLANFFDYWLEKTR